MGERDTPENKDSRKDISSELQDDSRKDNQIVGNKNETPHSQDNKAEYSETSKDDASKSEKEIKSSEESHSKNNGKFETAAKKSRTVSFNAHESLDNKRFRHKFRRLLYTAPKHPIFSSPFAKHISLKAFGPKKPEWYRKLDYSQLFSFRRLINHVEKGRKGSFRFTSFLKTFQEFDPTITREEIINVLDRIEVDEFEELDFGKFLFLLASTNQDSNKSSQSKGSLDENSIDEKSINRRNLILSAIADFVLLTSIADIEKYYIQNSKKKPNLLRNHLEVLRLEALNEAEMEIKQKKANRSLKPLFEITGSPYAQPVPFVPKFTKGKIYRDWKKSKYSLPDIDIHQNVSMPLVPPEVKLKLGEDVLKGSDTQNIVYKMNYGRIPIPKLHIPHEKVREMRGDFTVELKDYLMERALTAKRKFRNRLKNAAVLYAKTGLVPILQQGFPTKRDKENFIDVYQRYHPLD